MRAVVLTPGGYALLVCAALWFAVGALGPPQLSGPVFSVTGFAPRTVQLAHGDAALQIGFMRVAALILIPLISMRLFIDEKHTRSIVILLTSPVADWEIILGKWLGGMSMYLLIMAISGSALALTSVRHSYGSTGIASFVAMLILQGCGLMAIGESLSAVSKREATAAAVTMVVSWELLRWQKVGVLEGWDVALCFTLIGLGWALTWRSLHSLREGFCG